MDLDLGRLKKRLEQPLPGPAAHEPLRAVPSGPLRPKFEHSSPPRPGSVLILLYPQDGDLFFPLTKRPDYPGTHGGQISLPGGKAEPGESRIATALREAEEEIGILQHEVEVAGTLSEFFVIPSNYLITPVIGLLRSKPAFIPDPKEVVKIVHGSVRSILPNEAIRTKEILAARIYPLMAPHFEIEGEVVWGATAMILNEFRLVMKDVVG